MGFVRSSLAFILSVILFVTLLLTSIFLTLSWSTNYEIIKTGVSDYAKTFANGNSFFNLTEGIQAMEFYCMTHTNFVINEGELNLEIPCEVVNQGQEKVIEYGINQVSYDYYYKNYSCEFLDCVQKDKNFFVLFSLKAHDFWKYYSFVLLILSLVLFGLLILCVKNKSNSFIVLGVLLIFNSLILKSLIYLINLVPEKMISDAVSLFFSRADCVFLTFLILGILLIIIGIAIKLISSGSKISGEVSKVQKKGKVDDNIIEEKVKKAVKKEIKNINKKKSK